MMPNQCAIYVEGAKDSRIDFWNDVYGIDMSVMGDRVRKELANNNDIVGTGTSSSSSSAAGSTGKKTDVECSVTTVPLEDVTTSKAMLQSWDLNTCLDSDLDFVSSFRLLPKLLPTNNTSSSGSNDEINDNGKKEDDDNRNEEKGVILLDRLVISFDVTFNPPTTIITDSRNDKKDKVPSLQPPIILDTGCSSPRTHWQQTTLHLNANNNTATTTTTNNNNNGNDNEEDHHAQTKKQNRIELRSNEAMYGTLRLTRGATNKREIDVFVSWGVKERNIGPNNGDEDDTNNNSNNNTVDMIPSGPQWRMTGNVLGKLSAS